jgi:prepilin-type N-terminal cleavage/methylation domain-containing protein
MQKTKVSRGGFTLIELLVVIAIMGVFSTVVVQGMAMAKNRSINAAIQYTLSQIARQAADIDQLAEGGSGTGGGTTGPLCTYLFSNAKVQALILSAAEKAGQSVIHSYCTKSASQYRYTFLSPKFGDTSSYYCVDEYSAVREVSATNIIAILDAYSCGAESAETASDAPSDTSSEVASDTASDTSSETPSETPSETGTPPGPPLAIVNASVTLGDKRSVQIAFNQGMVPPSSSVTITLYTDAHGQVQTWQDSGGQWGGIYSSINETSTNGVDLCPAYSDDPTYGVNRYVTVEGPLRAVGVSGVEQSSFAASLNCPPVAEALSQCRDGIDNDADGYTDCSDIDCSAIMCFLDTEVCSDGIDNNNNGATDCADTACTYNLACVPTPSDTPSTTGATESDCTNNSDDDGDGNIDCADSDCSGHWACY